MRQSALLLRSLVRAGFVFVSLATSTEASHADRYEVRWSGRPFGGLALVQEDGAAAAVAIAGGTAFSVAYGFTNQLDVGVELTSMLTAPTFEGEMLVEGDIARGAFERRTSSLLLLCGPTWRLGSPDDWTPVFGVAVGAGVRHRSSGFFSVGLIPPGKSATTTFDFGASARAGVERRLNRRWTFGAYVSTMSAASPGDPLYVLASVSAGLSYVHYPP